jgi:hypothetical protein
MAGQGDVANAKDDTRLYAVGASITACTTDLSQYADNLTAGTSCVHEADSSRWSESSPPLAIEMSITANSVDSGYLYTHESASAGLRLSMASGVIIEARVNGAVSATLAVDLSGIGLSRENLRVLWSMEANVFTTGASDAYRSWLQCWNVTDGTFWQATATHAVPVDATGSAIWGASTTTGTNAYSGVITAIRWSVGRAHPWTEAREDFVANTAAPTLAFETRREVPVPTRASGAGDDGMFVGPIAMAVSAGLRQQDIRQASPQVQECYRDTPDQDDSPPAVRELAVPDAATWWFIGSYLERRSVPRTCNRLHVRVHIQAWRVDASPPDNVRLRLYTMNRPPGDGLVNAPGVQPWIRFFEELVVNADDGSGTTGGAWYTFDPARIARTHDQEGTWLALAFQVEDDGGGGLADQRWRVRAWTVEPGVIDSAGEIPLGGMA